jgi:hypothetical protein
VIDSSEAADESMFHFPEEGGWLSIVIDSSEAADESMFHLSKEGAVYL